jgi:hypothetical protein
MKKIILLLLLLYPVISGYAGEIRFEIKPGPHWKHTYRILGIVPLKLSPQLVVWEEDMEGNLIKTLYLSKRFYKIKRNNVLPVWLAKMLKQKDRPLITGATPKGSLTLSEDKDNQEKVRIFVEVNNSFDYNQYFSKNTKQGSPEHAGVDGQPALIYSGEIDSNAPGRYQLLATGVAGTDGKIDYDLSRSTTSLEIISSIEVIVE